MTHLRHEPSTTRDLIRREHRIYTDAVIEIVASVGGSNTVYVIVRRHALNLQNLGASILLPIETDLFIIVGKICAELVNQGDSVWGTAELCGECSRAQPAWNLVRCKVRNKNHNLWDSSKGKATHM